MELYTLNAQMQPDKIVENYDSLVWTERMAVGDFQITTGDVSFMQRLPEGTLLTLDESNHVFQVERHLTERKKGKAEVLTIKGRSWVSILDRRLALSALAGMVADWAVIGKIPSDAAYFIIHKICVEGILDPGDIFEPDKVQFPTPADYLTSTGPNRQFQIPKGNLLSAVLQLLQTEAKEDATTIPPTPAVVPHGIRAVRPNLAGSAVAIEIYTGTDKSDDVYFDGSRDLLDDGRYLFSKEGSGTTAYILGQSGAAKLNKTTTNPTGLNRRVIYVDATQSGAVGDDVLRTIGERNLSLAKETAIFDGSINQDLSPYTYGVDYNLGDVVKFVGDYGLESKARVTEYIRSKDATGTKSYPTLTSIDEEIS